MSMLHGLRGQDRLAAPHRLRGLIGHKLNVLLCPAPFFLLSTFRLRVSRRIRAVTAVWTAWTCASCRVQKKRGRAPALPCTNDGELHCALQRVPPAHSFGNRERCHSHSSTHRQCLRGSGLHLGHRGHASWLSAGMRPAFAGHCVLEADMQNLLSLGSGGLTDHSLWTRRHPRYLGGIS